MDDKSWFWDRVAEKYAKSKISNEEAYQKKLRQTRDCFTPHSEVLELGCGTGTTAIHHAAFVKHIDAIDVSEQMLRIAKKRAFEANVTNINFQRGDVDALKNTEKTYDVVMAHSLLHLLEDKDSVLQAIAKMLKPGGVFVSSTACLGKGFWWLKPIMPLMVFLKGWPRVQFFTPDDLRTKIRQNGFEIEVDWQPSKMQALFIVARKTA